MKPFFSESCKRTDRDIREKERKDEEERDADREKKRKKEREDRGWAQASLWEQYSWKSVKDLEWEAKSPDILRKSGRALSFQAVIEI